MARMVQYYQRVDHLDTGCADSHKAAVQRCLLWSRRRRRRRRCGSSGQTILAPARALSNNIHSINSWKGVAHTPSM